MPNSVSPGLVVLYKLSSTFNHDWTAELQYICSDMWQGYIKVIRKKASRAVHVLDRFHVMQRIGSAIDDVRAMRIKIEPMKKVARSLREKIELILNWFRAVGTISAGIVEGFNNKLKLITRKSYGFRTQKAYETA